MLTFHELSSHFSSKQIIPKTMSIVKITATATAVIAGVALAYKVVYNKVYSKPQTLSKVIDIRPYCIQCNSRKERHREVCIHGSGVEPLYRILEDASISIYVCMYIFTDSTISDILLKAKDRGVDVRVITDTEMAYANKSFIPTFYHAGGAIKWKKSPHPMHHKCCIVDKKIVLTGSFNWTDQATRGNYENLLILTNPRGVDKFQAMFDYMWREFSPFVAGDCLNALKS